MKDKIYWTMKNGSKIDIDKMTLEHLRNTLKMIIRNNTPKNGIVPFSESEVAALLNRDEQHDNWLWK